MFAGPFVRINGNPLLMINIPARRFSILGQIFWPQDVAIFAVAMLLFLTGIIIFTTAFGRLWCGWTCPQTLLMEMVFRKIEYAIEGDAPAQRALSAAPWSMHKLFKRGLKQVIFLVLSFVIGNTLLSYIIGSDELFHLVTDNPANHLQGLTFMVLFTMLFYAIFARFREQACTFICPYGRFQSTILDENTMVVAYDKPRGEHRAKLDREHFSPARSTAGLGDCIDCHQCVAVCPTGIDIRNGTQMECVNCAACIDACDSVMDRVQRPRGLIRYASHNSIERGQKFRFTGRMKLYAGVLGVLISAFIYLVFTRSAVEADLLRAPGALYQTAPDGGIENLYLLHLVNKTSHDLPVVLKLEKPSGELKLLGAEHMVVPKDQLATTSVLIDLPKSSLTGHNTKIRIGVFSGDKRLETIDTVFIGPRDETQAPVR
jgi:cytochrome c oxidase accessory protein FixG